MMIVRKKECTALLKSVIEAISKRLNALPGNTSDNISKVLSRMGNHQKRLDEIEKYLNRAVTDGDLGKTKDCLTDYLNAYEWAIKGIK